MPKGMLSFIIWGAVAYLLFGGILFGCQRSLLYHPNQTVPDPSDYGLRNVSVERIASEAEHELLAWWHEPQSAEAPVLIYFHGNAGHLGHRAEKISPYLDAGVGVLLVTYRYNAGAGGSPSEEGLYADGRAAMNFIQGLGIPPARVFVYGEALGTAVAVTIAAENTVGGVILEAPYTSIADVAQTHYWYIPARILLFDKFDVTEKIKRIDAPLLLIHGERDAIIPVKFGRALFNLAREPKVAHFVADAGHNDLHYHGMPRRVLQFLRKLFPGTIR